jgi:hypothetical protein
MNVEAELLSGLVRDSDVSNSVNGIAPCAVQLSEKAIARIHHNVRPVHVNKM